MVVDTLDALEDPGDLIEPLRSRIVEREEIVQLRHLVLDGAQITGTRSTVFKTVGYALAEALPLQNGCISGALAPESHALSDSNRNPR